MIASSVSGVDDARHRRSRARPEVGRRARDRAGHRDAADQRRRRCWPRPGPCSSAFELWRSPVIESATTADSRLSTAASSATVRADGSSGRIRSARNCRKLDGRQASRNAAELRSDRLDRQAERGNRQRCRATSATIEPGHARQPLAAPAGPARATPAPSASGGRRRRCASTPRVRVIRAKNSLGGSRHRKPEEVLDLRRGDQQRDAVGEADDHRPRNELHRLPEAGHRQHHQDHAGHHRDHQQAGEAVRRDDAGDDHDERARRTADLDARSAEQRHEEAADDGGVDAGLWRDARRDAERHRERQRDDADGQAGDEVGGKRMTVVAGERIEQLRPPPLPGDVEFRHLRLASAGRA